MAKKATKKFKLSKQTKAELRSALHTFLSAFVITIMPVITTVDWRSVEQSAIIAIALAGLRAGIKALSLYFFPQK